jgi:hypothetical protein
MGRGTAEALVGKQMQDFKEAVAKYDGKLDTKKIETDQKNAKDKVAGFLDAPVQTTFEFLKEKAKNALGMGETNQPTTTPQPTTQVIKHEISVSSKDTFSDSFARELNRDSSLVSQWAERAPSDLTTPSVANK